MIVTVNLVCVCKNSRIRYLLFTSYWIGSVSEITETCLFVETIHALSRNRIGDATCCKMTVL